MSEDHSYLVDPPVRTDVSVYLGDCKQGELQLVCEGTSLLFSEPRWQRARAALNRPSPRGPFPVNRDFTIFIYEVREGPTHPQVMSTLHIYVECRSDKLVHATVHSTLTRRLLLPFPYMIGDDVVTLARNTLDWAAACTD